MQLIVDAVSCDSIDSVLYFEVMHIQKTTVAAQWLWQLVCGCLVCFVLDACYQQVVRFTHAQFILHTHAQNLKRRVEWRSCSKKTDLSDVS